MLRVGTHDFQSMRPHNAWHASEAAHGGDQLGRTTLVFETAFPKYAWLNRIVPVAGGRREASGPVYEVHEVL